MIKSREIKSMLVAATLCVVSSGWTAAMAHGAFTGQPQLPPLVETTTAIDPPPVASKCRQLIGTTVENPQGEKLGKIAGVVVHLDKERVSCCVLSVKAGIFTKTRFLAVPLAAFKPSVDGSHLILNSSKANLAKAKGFDLIEWPSAITPVCGVQPATPVELPPAVAITAAVAFSYRDKKFVSEFSNISLELERIGQLAQTRSQDTQVKELGKKLVQDYTSIRQQVATSAQAAGVGRTLQFGGSAAREINKLANLSGETFDQTALHELFKCEESGARQLDLEVANGGNLALRQLAGLLQVSTEPDLWQTVLLSAQFNGHP
jgi:predicted outer membrane protein